MAHLTDPINLLDSVLLNRYRQKLSSGYDTGRTEWVDDVSKITFCRLWLHLHIRHKHSEDVHCRNPEVIQKCGFVRTVSRSICADCGVSCMYLVYHACYS